MKKKHLPQLLLVGCNNAAPIGDLLASLNFALPENADTEWIELIPIGPQVVGRDGRKWINDDPAGIVAAFNADGRDIVIDVEHATEIKAPKGEPAPAAGWITALEVRTGAVWGKVAWNADGRSAIENRSYRYYSPVFLFEKAGGRIVQMRSVGLTNIPNLRLTALNQQTQPPPEQEAIMIKKLLKALGLAEDATEDQALNALTNLQNDLAVAQNRAQTPDLAKFVPRADYDAALAKATNAEKALADRVKADLDGQITAEVDAALKAGKITPATKDYYTAMCRQENGLEEFKKFVAAAPVIGDPSHLDRQPPKGHESALNTEQQIIADMFGNSAEDIAKYGN